MKVLWFTNIPMLNVCDVAGIQGSPKGGWMNSLANALIETGEIELAVATNVMGVELSKYQTGGIKHFILPARSYLESHFPPTADVLSLWKQVIDEFQPDIIHFHGTERYYGMLTSQQDFNIPSVISIQGLTSVYHRYYLGGLTFGEVLFSYSLRDIRHWDGLFQRKQQFKRLSKMEQDIIKSNHNFIGRTRWDKAHVFAMNPTANYYHGDELLRPPFHTAIKNSKCVVRHSIFAPTASYPLKGFHWLLRSVAILKSQFPDVTLRVADAQFSNSWRAEGYNRYLNRLIRDLGLEKNVIPVGMLSAEEMALELTRAHVFVAPSLVENLCNGLAEAMLVGTPCVAAFAGGMTTTVKDGETALCFPPGDEAVMAECIRRFFLDDELAEQLSSAAQVVARARHDNRRVASDMLNIYRDCIGNM